MAPNILLDDWRRIVFLSNASSLPFDGLLDPFGEAIDSSASAFRGTMNGFPSALLSGPSPSPSEYSPLASVAIETLAELSLTKEASDETSSISASSSAGG
jgi:hypothetical protein